MKKIKIFFIVLVVVFVSSILILNFIPVKFAKKISVSRDKKDGYIVKYTTATSGNWHASVEDNPHLEEDLYINIEPEYKPDDFKKLEEIYNCRYGDLIQNKYVFYGDLEYVQVGSEPYQWEQCVLKVTDWDIVYPIRRQTLLGIIAPRSYLNIFDYVWGD